MQETVSETIDRTLNARALHKINTNSNYAHLGRIVGRLTRSLQLARPCGLPVCVAGVPALPLCETPGLGV